MKKAIFTLAIGNENPMYQAALLSFEQYAKKVGADLIVSREFHYPITIENPRHTASPAWTEKLYIKELLKEYDRVLYIDADIIITPHAKDIFETYTDLETLYMFNEGKLMQRQEVINKITRIMGDVEGWPQTNDMPVYYNLGCMLVSKDCPLFDIATLEDLQKVCNHIKYYEQTYVNFLIHKHGLKHVDISGEFNRLDVLGTENYLDGSFIHYAGRGYTNSTLKREAKFIIDFCHLFKGILPQETLDKLLHDGWELYLNKAQKRFKLPRFATNFIIRNLMSM